MIVYHYTPKASLDQILQTGQFIPSNPWTTMDSSYGNGWYFTDLGPEQCEVFVMNICWKKISIATRVTHYLKFDIDSSILQCCREHVFMVSTWDEELIKFIGSGQSDPCGSKPCETCEKGKKYRI